MTPTVLATPSENLSLNLATACEAARHNTILPIIPRAHLARFVPIIVALVIVAILALILASIRNPTRIPIVTIDPTNRPAIPRNDIVKHQVTGTSVVAAVSATSRNFAIVLSVKVLDADGSEAVELYDLVGGGKGAATVNVGCAAALLESAVGC